MNPPLISVIIPVYNIENYVEKCILSVLAQTYENIEIIIVNDGSTDSSPVICQKYADSDSRIVLINKENGGLSDARNKGLEVAKGEYLTFIDGDDFVSKDFINTLYRELVDNDADISMTNYLKVYSNNQAMLGNSLWNDEKLIIFTGLDGINYLLEYKAYVNLIVSWNKLYKRELFDGIWFPYGKINEDSFVIYKLFYRTQKIAYVNEPLYYYVRREGSIIHSAFSNRRYNMVEANKEMFDLCIEHNIFLPKAAKRYFFTYWDFIEKYKKYELREPELEQKYKDDFFTNYKEKKKLLNKADRIKLLIKIYTPFLEKGYKALHRK